MMIKIYDQNQSRSSIALWVWSTEIHTLHSNDQTQPNEKGEHIVSNDADTENLGSPKVHVDVTSF